MSKSEKTSNIIFYPRSYNKRGDPAMHSMMGMTSDGELINVKLRIDEKYLKQENHPSIVEFARSDYNAKMVCIASDTNGPENSEGILLLSRCSLEGRDRGKNIDVYVAKWAEVIKADSNSSNPIQGISRIMIQEESSQVKKLRGIQASARRRGNDDEVKALQEKIEDPKNWSYPVIFYFPEEIGTVDAGNVELFRSMGAEMIDKRSEDGLIGGVAVRALNQYGQVVKDSYLECQARFIVGEERLQSGLETMESLLEDWPEEYEASVTQWQLIPIMKVTAGQKANRGCSSTTEAYRYIETMYYHKDRPRVALGISKVLFYANYNNTLVDKHFNLSEPLGDPARLDAQGTLGMTFAGEDLKLAHINKDEPIVEKDDGIIPMDEYRPRAMWLVTGEGVPVSSVSKNQEKKPDQAPAVQDPDSVVNSEKEGSEQEEDAPSPTSVMDEKDDQAVELDFESTKVAEERSPEDSVVGPLDTMMEDDGSEDQISDDTYTGGGEAPHDKGGASATSMMEELNSLPPIGNKAEESTDSETETVESGVTRKDPEESEEDPGSVSNEEVSVDEEGPNQDLSPTPNTESEIATSPEDVSESDVEKDDSDSDRDQEPEGLTGMAAFLAKRNND